MDGWMETEYIQVGEAILGVLRRSSYRLTETARGTCGGMRTCRPAGLLGVLTYPSKSLLAAV